MLWSTESRVPQLLGPYATAAETQVPWNLPSAMRGSTGAATGEGLHGGEDSAQPERNRYSYSLKTDKSMVLQDKSMLWYVPPVIKFALILKAFSYLESFVYIY